MARVKYAALVSDISGSIGSATFQKSLYGNTLRNKPRNRKSGSPIQMSMRYVMMQLHQAWAAMTDAQRRQWNQFVSYSGASINRDRSILLTGHSLFLKYNFLRLINKQSILTSFTYTTIPPIPIPDGLFIDSGDFNFYTDFVVNPTYFWYVLKLSVPRRSSLSFSPAGLRFIYVTPITGSGWYLNTSYISVFGKIPDVNDFLHYSIQFYSMTSPVISQKQTGIYQVSER